MLPDVISLLKTLWWPPISMNKSQDLQMATGFTLPTHPTFTVPSALGNYETLSHSLLSGHTDSHGLNVFSKIHTLSPNLHAKVLSS
jgi:hypothetical protein